MVDHSSRPTREVRAPVSEKPPPLPGLAVNPMLQVIHRWCLETPYGFQLSFPAKPKLDLLGWSPRLKSQVLFMAQGPTKNSMAPGHSRNQIQVVNVLWHLFLGQNMIPCPYSFGILLTDILPILILISPPQSHLPKVIPDPKLGRLWRHWNDG
jgi:hypothetical protein